MSWPLLIIAAGSSAAVLDLMNRGWVIVRVGLV